MTKLTRDSVEAAFYAMGELLLPQSGEILVVGQAAIMLQYAAITETDDVDVRIDVNHGAVQRAAHTVAERHGWLRSWLNDAVVQYLPSRQCVRLFGDYPSDLRKGLRVYVGRPKFLLALKLGACRNHDLDDAILLAKDTKMTNPTALHELFRSFYPDHQPDGVRDARRTQFILTVAERYG